MKRLLLALSLFAALPAHAVEPDEVLADPALETRARTISKDLRCLVCQNQSIDDSDAPLAHDLRRLVRQRLTAGDGDAAVKAFIADRYGDFVLLRPPFQENTWILWLGPPAVLMIGAGALAVWFRRVPRLRSVVLTAEEDRRLAALLDEDDR